MTTVVEVPHVASIRRRLPPSVGRWPAKSLHRWMLRIALGIPYMWIALIAGRRGILGDANERLDQAGQSISWGADDLEFVQDIYPPFPTAIASLLPNGAIWSGLIGAVCGGIVLQTLWERLHGRDVPLGLTILLLLSVGGIPAFWFAATQDLAAFVGLALFALALSGLLRFAVDGDTEGGFQCGLALGVAAMCDPATLVFAVCLGAAAPLIAWRRYRGQDGAILATLVVVLFPTIAALAGWAFIEWQFTGGAFQSLSDRDDWLAFPGGFWATVGRELANLGIRLLISPVFVVAAVLIARRRPIALGAQALVLFAVLATQVLGINVGVGQGLLILASIGVMTVERAPDRSVIIAFAIASVIQIPLQWYPWRPNAPVAVFVEQLFG